MSRDRSSISNWKLKVVQVVLWVANKRLFLLSLSLEPSGHEMARALVAVGSRARSQPGGATLLFLAWRSTLRQRNCGGGSPVARESLLEWQITPILCMLWLMFTFALLIFFSFLYLQKELMITEIIFGPIPPFHPSMVLPGLIQSPGKASQSLTCSICSSVVLFF